MTHSTANEVLDPPAKILIIDDSPLNRCFVENAFKNISYEVISAINATQGQEKAKAESPELILMDVMMPGIDGFTATENLKADPQTKDIPVIFITALDAVRDKLKAFDAGAVDFVTKPFNHKELIARVHTNIVYRRSIAEKERLVKEAMEGKRSESIANIAAGISHNFNNMLGAASGNTMLIKMITKNTLDVVSQDAIDDILTNLTRMQNMVKQFLLLADRSNEVKGGIPEASSTDMHSMVEKVICDTEFKNDFASNVQNAVITGDKALVDESHIVEVFQLILTEVEALTDSQASCIISTQASPQENALLCTVRIEGLHIDPELRDAVFEPFSLPIVNVGTGLSFSVCKQLLELNKCSITAEFENEDNVTFVISLIKA